MSGIICARSTNLFAYRVFTRNNLLEVIDWLGGNFVAITNGGAVTISGATIQYGDDASKTLPGLGTGLLVIRNGMNNQLIAASVGSYIVEDPMLGYVVLSEESFDRFYRDVPQDDITDPDEPKAETPAEV